MFQKRMTMNFEYEEDKKYFAALLDEIGGLENNYGLFDFRSPDIKRSEFNKIRNSVFLGLLEKYGSICQLHCHEDCSNKATQVDHLIPLSSNILNKKIRSIKGEKGKKVPAQSFGSNHESNFVLACVRCNAYKKHGFPTKEILHYIIKVRNDKNNITSASTLTGFTRRIVAQRSVQTRSGEQKQLKRRFSGQNN